MSAEPLDRPSGPALGAAVLDEDSSPELEDSFTLYVRRVSRAPLLTAAEERDLFQRKEAGDATATRRLIEANLRLVIWVARRYARSSVPLLDLIQEGNLALTRAVERFDYRLGCRLSTYATWWIRQAVERAAASHARVLPVPLHVLRQIQHVRRTRQVLLQRLSREPRLGELAAEVGLKPRRVQELLEYEQLPVSLEAPLGDGEADCADMLEDTSSPRPESAAAERMRKEELGSLLNVLDDRLRLVLELRFGLDGGAPRSLEEVGRQLGVTRERARQLEDRALRKLRQAAPELREYLNAV